MSLNWDTRNVKYFQDNPDDLFVTYGKGTKEEYEDLNVETKSLVFGSMAVGIGAINYKLAPSWYARWKVLEKYDDFYLYSKFIDGNVVRTYLTPEILTKHKGLTTNVSDETDAKWCKRISIAYVKKDETVTYQYIKKLIDNFKKEYELLV